VIGCRWCNIILLNVHGSTEEKSDNMKDRFYVGLEHVFDKFTKCHKKIMLGYVNDEVGREDIFKPCIWNDSLLKISNDNGIGLVNFATSKNLTVKSTMFRHRNIYKFTWISPDVKT
jgi:hypothetical protein